MRADRLIAIVLQLQLKKRMTAKELAEALEVSERTIYRDIDALCAAGVPVVAEAGLGGGFSLPADYRTKADGLNRAEIQSLFLLLNEQPFKQIGLGQAAKTALLKIADALPERMREDGDWIQNRVIVDWEGWRPSLYGSYLEAAQQAVWEQREVRLGYTDRFDRRYELTVEPYGLVMKGGIWFLVGRDAEGMKTLRFDRLDGFETTERTFERNGEFRLKAFWQRWTAAYGERRKQYTATVEAEPETLQRIAAMRGVTAEPGETAEAEPGAGAAESRRQRSRFGFESEDDALRAVMALGAEAKAVAPESLRQRIREQARLLLRQYEDDGAAGRDSRGIDMDGKTAEWWADE